MAFFEAVDIKKSRMHLVIYEAKKRRENPFLFAFFFIRLFVRFVFGHFFAKKEQPDSGFASKISFEFLICFLLLVNKYGCLFILLQ